MDTARTSNIKSLGIVAFVSIVLFGVFYYLITDAINNPSISLKTEKKPTNLQVLQQKTTERKSVESEVKNNEESANTTANVMGYSTENSVFKSLATQKVDEQPKMVLAGADENTPESTVPDTGTNTIFVAFVVSSLIMFAGIYMLVTQPKNVALVKFEKRIIRELD